MICTTVTEYVGLDL